MRHISFWMWLLEWVTHRKEGQTLRLSLFCDCVEQRVLVWTNPYYVISLHCHVVAVKWRDSKCGLHVWKKGFKKILEARINTSYNLLFIIHNLRSCLVWVVIGWRAGINVPHELQAQLEILFNVLNHHFYYPNV